MKDRGRTPLWVWGLALVVLSGLGVGAWHGWRVFHAKWELNRSWNRPSSKAGKGPNAFLLAVRLKDVEKKQLNEAWQRINTETGHLYYTVGIEDYSSLIRSGYFQYYFGSPEEARTPEEALREAVEVLRSLGLPPGWDAAILYNGRRYGLGALSGEEERAGPGGDGSL